MYSANHLHHPINVYRPPKSSSKSFFNLLKHVQSYLDKHINVKHYDINILEDFNFPNIDWSSSNCNPSHGREQQLADEALLSFIDYNMLHQVVNTPTRETSLNSSSPTMKGSSAIFLLRIHPSLTIVLYS